MTEQVVLVPERPAVTRHNIGQLDELKALADSYGAQLRLTRLRPSGRAADSWPQLHPTAEQQRQVYDWLAAHGPDPECVRGLGEQALAAAGPAAGPRPAADHSHRRGPVPVTIGRPPARACDENPLAGLAVGGRG